jgi:signal transduction histidine kinase
LALPAVSQRLQSTLVVDDVGFVVARSITEGLNVPYAAVRLGQGELLAADGVATPGAHLERFPVTYLGELVAEIEVEPRPAEVSLHRRDRSTLSSLAAHAGPVLHGVQAQRHIADAYRQLELAREDERERIRFDLHDDLAPTLAGLGLRAAAAAAIEATDPERARQLQVEVRDGLREAVAQVREIAHDLRPTFPEGLEATLRRRLAIEQDESLEIEIDATGPLGELSSEVELAVLRIVQEAVTNVRRHASASRCDVLITCSAQEIEVRVTDDGRGITHDARPSIGLVSLEQRATSLGGQLAISDTHGGGTTVLAVLPLGDGAVR